MMKHARDDMTEVAEVIGMAWFTPETWRQLRAHPEAKIEDAYSEYVRRYERAIAAFTARGFRVVRDLHRCWGTGSYSGGICAPDAT